MNERTYKAMKSKQALINRPSLKYVYTVETVIANFECQKRENKSFSDGYNNENYIFHKISIKFIETNFDDSSVLLQLSTDKIA